MFKLTLVIAIIAIMFILAGATPTPKKYPTLLVTPPNPPSTLVGSQPGGPSGSALSQSNNPLPPLPIFQDRPPSTVFAMYRQFQMTLNIRTPTAAWRLAMIFKAHAMDTQRKIDARRKEGHDPIREELKRDYIKLWSLQIDAMIDSFRLTGPPYGPNAKRKIEDCMVEMESLLKYNEDIKRGGGDSRTIEFTGAWARGIMIYKSLMKKSGQWGFAD